MHEGGNFGQIQTGLNKALIFSDGKGIYLILN